MTLDFGRFKLSIIVASGCLAAALASAPTAMAARGEGYGTITARSQFGYGTISAPTRPGKFGPEVRLPGGSWISCAGDCRETLVRQTLDFWVNKDLDRPTRR